jgi:hypothetical protein
MEERQKLPRGRSIQPIVTYLVFGLFTSYCFHSFPVVDRDFVCLYTYEFWLSLCKIARSSVILLLPLLFAFLTFLFCGQTFLNSRINVIPKYTWWKKGRSYQEVDQYNQLWHHTTCLGFVCVQWFDVRGDCLDCSEFGNFVITLIVCLSHIFILWSNVSLSTIPPIATKQTITSHIKSLNITNKKLQHMTLEYIWGFWNLTKIILIKLFTEEECTRTIILYSTNV